MFKEWMDTDYQYKFSNGIHQNVKNGDAQEKHGNKKTRKPCQREY